MLMATEKEVVIKKEKPINYFGLNEFTTQLSKTETTEKELDRFKNDYNPSRLNKVYEKYDMYQEEEVEIAEKEDDFYQDFAPVTKKTTPKKDVDFNKLLKEQNSFEESEETLTYQKVSRDPKVKLNFSTRTKLMIGTYSFVIIMLGFLLIHNLFALGNLNSNIGDLNQSISSEQVNIERIIKDIGNMTDETAIIDIATDLSFSPIPPENVVQVSLYQKQSPPVYKGQTNWFDAICNFFQNLFGG